MRRATTPKGTKWTSIIDQQYIDRQTRRARRLFWFLMAILVVTIIMYVAVHLQTQPGGASWQWVTLTSSSGWQAKALDWLLWSLAGTAVYLLFEIASHYPAISDQARKAPPPPSFEEFTPWYLVNLIRGPIIAVVILFFFDAAQLKLTGPDSEPGIAFVFAELDYRVTLLLAFVFGFYSRVARHVLDGIVKSLFSRAWAEANEDFSIELGNTSVALGGDTLLKTTPATDVVWAASLGTVDGVGKYTAPKDRQYAGSTVVITAVSKGAYPIAKSASIALEKQ